VRLRKLTLLHFRNVGLATLEFSGRQQFFVGANGQGKTNLLEGAGFLTALRSFRTSDHKLLISRGQQSAALTCDVEHERLGDTHVTIKLLPEGKEVWCDQTRVTKLADYLGQFPTVVFSSPDLQMVRGSPALRRRWLDLTLASADPTYFRALQVFTRGLAERNALLRSGRPAELELAAFEQALAPAAVELIGLRATGVAALAESLQQAYVKLCADSEPASLGYEPNFREPSVAALLARFASGRARDLQFRTTLVGPHRDDITFSIKHLPARDFASEGQQRSFVLALRLAQAAWFQQKTGVRPVLLADDVLGELDPARRARFWSAIDPESQVLASGTDLPDPGLGEWQVFAVADGVFAERPAREELSG
jgi:DNA replication and repair protein RecF